MKAELISEYQWKYEWGGREGWLVNIDLVWCWERPLVRYIHDSLDSHIQIKSHPGGVSSQPVRVSTQQVPWESLSLSENWRITQFTANYSDGQM